MTHWLTTFDPDDGDPIGSLCHCDIDADHDGTGDLMFPEPEPQQMDAIQFRGTLTREQAEGITGMQWDNLGHGG